MQRANYARTIYYLCLDQTASAPPVLQSAFDLLAIPVPQIEPEQLLQAYQADKHKILLLNYDEHDAIRQRLAPLRLTSPHLETILFQVGKRLCTDDLLSFGNLKGLFYQPSEPEQIARGLAEIINGQNWLPRHVSSQLLHYYRHIFQGHHRTHHARTTDFAQSKNGRIKYADGRKLIYQRIYRQISPLSDIQKTFGEKPHPSHRLGEPKPALIIEVISTFSGPGLRMC